MPEYRPTRGALAASMLLDDWEAKSDKSDIIVINQ